MPLNATIALELVDAAAFQLSASDGWGDRIMTETVSNPIQYLASGC